MKFKPILQAAGAFMIASFLTDIVFGDSKKKIEQQPERLTATNADESEETEEQKLRKLEAVRFLQGRHSGFQQGYIEASREVAGRFGIPPEQINTVDAARVVNRYAIP